MNKNPRAGGLLPACRLAACCLGVVAGSASADEAAAAPFAESFTGSWGGERTRFAERGLLFEGGYKADFLRVTSGGLQHGGRPMGHLDLSLTANLETLAGWSGTTVYLNYLHDHGETINATHLGSLLGVSNIEVAVDTYRFFHAWVQKEWGDGRFSLLGGLYPIDSEFQVLDSAAIFVQPPYGPTAELSLTRGPSIFNTSAFGVRGRWLSEDRAAYVQAAVLDGVPGDPDHPKGTHIKFADGDGTMSIAEVGYLPPAAVEMAAGAALGKIAAGLWGYSARVDDLVEVDANGDPLKRRSRGAYVLAEGRLWQAASGPGLDGFARYSRADGDSTAICATASVGLYATAPFAGRPDDALGLAYTRAEIGEKFLHAQRASGQPAVARESAWELTYRFVAAPWLSLQPVVQRFRNPGAVPAIRSATVAGLRVELVL